MRYAVYWDASAVISSLLDDAHTSDALAWLHKDCAHLMSSLAYAETCSILSRLFRDKAVTEKKMDVALESISSAPWLRLKMSPGWDEISEAARRWNLRGAALWHLAMALTLRRRGRSDLKMLTFDDRLRRAANDAGFI